MSPGPNKQEKNDPFFRLLIEHTSDIIAVLDSQSNILYASPSVGRVLGYSSEEFTGRKILDFIHSEDAENAGFLFSQMKEKKELALEFRFRCKNGSWRQLEAIGKAVPDQDGQVRMVLNARDITDRIVEQEALRESIIRHLKTQTELQKTQQKIIQRERLAAIGQMASGIAHDFSNALMPVLGFTEILLKKPENMQDLKRVQRYMEMINTSARDAMHIVGGLREFYRTKEKVENLSRVDLNKIIEQTVAMTQLKWKEESNAKNIAIHVRMELGQIPPMTGNEAALREALTNLIFNAVDAMPYGGQITFSTRPEEGKIVLEVSDTGVGMSEETRVRCFEPFFSSKEKGGTGLGLAMTYGIVTRHSGAIEVKSQEGRGTTFMVHLPVRNTPVGEAPVKSPSCTDKFPRKLNVLVVDDEAMVRDVLKEYLTGDGHEVETAVDGVNAWEIFQKKKFDLVITDRAMPEMNGDELADRIKKHASNMPLIMLTGFGELMKTKEEHPKGVDLLMSKPLTLEAYREAIFKALPNRS